ncbi:MAG TPA: TlpA disulfide reductase family protein [Blastocatellia bacterium]|nr:TlpA disulfide reductase family protein [Blastocatellia bacterium]
MNFAIQSSRFTSSGRLICLLTLLSPLALSSACSRQSAVTETSPPSQATQLRDFDVKMLDAPAVKVSQLTASNKVLVFDFWATWCGPCRLEIPHLVELQRDYKDKGVEVIGLSIEDPKIHTELVRNFAKEMNINYRLGFASDEMFSTFTAGSGSIPQTLIFDRNGKLVKHIRGIPRQPGLIRTWLRESVDKALAQS